MCQVGCINENYYGDCTLHLGYCPIEFKNYIATNMKRMTKENNFKLKDRKIE